MKHIKCYYGLICNLLVLDLNPSLKVLIRMVLLRLRDDCFPDFIPINGIVVDDNNGDVE